MPSKTGLLLILVLAAMLIASMNYASNMAYLLTFVLVSVVVVSLIVTRKNLSGLSLKSVQPQAAFAGGTMRMILEIENQAARPRLSVYIAAPRPGKPDRLSGPYFFPARSVRTVEISLPVDRRGLHRLRLLTLVSVFPLGIFLRWLGLKAEKEYIVYPKPAGSRSWPQPTTMWFENVEGFHFSGGDDFTGLRPYREGESQHHIDWKAYARGRPLNVKEFTGGGSYQLWFEWQALSGMGGESRLSQLTRWILEADNQGKEFGLRLPGVEIGPDSGSRHTLICLRELALFKVV
jgi:uncharacterized protein (DUF58 family)